MDPRDSKSQPPKAKAASASAQDKKEKLAKALRENLLRRKAAGKEPVSQ